MKQSAEVEAKINALIESMTVEEMAGQLTQIWGSEVQDTNPVTAKTKHEDLLGQIRAGMVGSLLGAHGAEYINELQRAAVKESKHGIPLIIGNDVIHGYRTMFPIPLGGAATWDVDLIEKSERVAAIECAAMGTHWTFAPMIDVCRDPRWGRVAEGAGEDPMLGSAMAAARVRGFQGKDLTAKDTVLACAKHFVAYGGAEGGRDYNTVDISLQTLHDVYLPPFKAAVNVGAGSIMSAFNEVNGVPASANPYTLTTVLRDQWGFGGFVVSDWSSVTEVIPHGFAVDAADADAKAITAGVDMDMSSMSYREHLPSLVKSGKVSKAVVEEAVRRVLRMKFALGLFDDPYLDTELEKKVILTDENRALAREVARSSFVLLRNEDSLLPIKDDVKSIAVIGPLAESKRDPLGTWAGVAKAEDVVSVMEGLKSRAGEKVSVRYAKGCDISSDDTSGFSEAVELTKDSDLVVIVIGESAEMSGEAHSRSSVELPGVQRELVQAVAKTGKPVVVVLLNGRPMALPWIAENIPAILVTWHAGIECGNAVADVLFGDFNPCGKLPSTFPRKTGQIPIYLGHKNTGRPPTTERYTSKYIDLPWTPLYPFGYGLSYTTFGYSNLNIASSDIKRDGTLSVTVDVANTGKVAGAEIVQLYVRDLVGSMTRPVKELKAFRKVTLAPGESQNIAFDVAASELGFHNWDMEYVVEPGEFQLWVGGSSTGDVEGRFQIVE
ncbi:MAG: glycoside hydrolase family 3 C-terminal domain-containing protein [Phycisphaerales bacterium]|nr:glycoside hydrolase family 3 C-terminal domain-containing protein [Phycisphaerales bacterium]